MIDSGSDANLLKKECINPAININEKDKIILQGISSERKYLWICFNHFAWTKNKIPLSVG